MRKRRVLHATHKLEFVTANQMRKPSAQKYSKCGRSAIVRISTHTNGSVREKTQCGMHNCIVRLRPVLEIAWITTTLLR